MVLMSGWPGCGPIWIRWAARNGCCRICGISWPRPSGSCPGPIPEQRPRVRQDIEELRKRIAEQERLVADPQAAARQTEERIAAGLERERQPDRPEVAPARARFVNPPPMAAPG